MTEQTIREWLESLVDPVESKTQRIIIEWKQRVIYGDLIVDWFFESLIPQFLIEQEFSETSIESVEEKQYWDSYIEYKEENNVLVRFRDFFRYSNFRHNYEEWLYHMKWGIEEDQQYQDMFWECLEPNFSIKKFYL